ncbi:hypothetical protein EXIGLDRAFT_834792 [Exidia glandulosa HHB12029]|uniref:Wax synthase domain-containing protein n=1 Tax=Exidia glandulosa HHB12029 TaxID=1314781 RepID=A0A166ASA8_EXIGL|nr:hypothetical protein EXIGLDRAFT_834792 [Exidia glandulosa HHB12029]
MSAVELQTSFSPLDLWLRPAGACGQAVSPDDVAKFASAVFPLLLCYFATAVLALIPGTASKAARFALLPVSLSFALDGSTSPCYVFHARELRHLNLGICMFHITFSLRCIEWAVSKAPLRRVYPQADKANVEATAHLANGNGHAQVHIGNGSDMRTGLSGLLIAACDLSVNARGIGWEWGKGCKIPAEWRNTTSRATFLRQTAWSAAKNLSCFDLAFSILQLLRPRTHAASTPMGWSIFDPTKSIGYNIASALANSFCVATCVYGADSGIYNLFTIVAVALGDDPSRWPPLFNSPWAMTSLADFWSNRWHQLFRRPFILFGGLPGTLIGGRFGGVMGSFIVSGLLHDGALWGLRGGMALHQLTAYFILQGFALLLEGAVSRTAGKRVGGVGGRIWATAVILVSGALIAEPWMTRGLGYSLFLPTSLRPGWFLLNCVLGIQPFEPL